MVGLHKAIKVFIQRVIKTVEFQFLEPTGDSNWKLYHTPQSTTTILPLIYQTNKFINPIVHFWVNLYLCFCEWVLMQNLTDTWKEFTFMKMNLYGERGERHSHINGFAHRLILKQMQMAVWNWPIVPRLTQDTWTSDHKIKFMPSCTFRHDNFNYASSKIASHMNCIKNFKSSLFCSSISFSWPQVLANSFSYWASTRSSI